jgi:hypothetical protein
MPGSHFMAQWQMTESYFFLLLINILKVRSTPEKAVLTKAGMAILRRNCGLEVPILNDPTS